MTNRKNPSGTTIIVKGVKNIAPRAGKLPAGTVCVKTVKLPDHFQLPAGTAAVQLVKLPGAKSNALDGYAVKSLSLCKNGALPAGSVIVSAVRHSPRMLTIEVSDVIEHSMIDPSIDLGISVPEIPPMIGKKKGDSRKLGIRVPIIPPHIIKKK